MSWRQVFVFITEIFWQTFLRNNWRSIFYLVKILRQFNRSRIHDLIFVLFKLCAPWSRTQRGRISRIREYAIWLMWQKNHSFPPIFHPSSQSLFLLIFSHDVITHRSWLVDCVGRWGKRKSMEISWHLHILCLHIGDIPLG